MEQANWVIKDNLSKRIEATGNSNWSEHLVRVALAMNTQGHSSLPYNITPYEVFFGRKYCNHASSPTIVGEACSTPIRFTNDWINDAVDKNLPIIDEVMKKYVEHEACEEDGEEDREEDREENGEEDGEENGEENGEEDGEENGEEIGEEREEKKSDEEYEDEDEEEDNITNMILEDTGKPQKFIILWDF